MAKAKLTMNATVSVRFNNPQQHTVQGGSGERVIPGDPADVWLEISISTPAPQGMLRFAIAFLYN